MKKTLYRNKWMEMGTKRFQEIRRNERRENKKNQLEGLIRSSERLSKKEQKVLGGGNLEVFKNFQDTLTRIQKGIT